ncbi:UDP-glucosyl transferase 88A1 [Pyrus ussuriensis x Pyrus communis]|uniref:UDP-glucosyl transferase 88A1 n=1 Tax=Pyrus ussuriensis x Pyrus communis TaxID=2448454 RepID=A0A5N5HMK0_9ROSA|nr:UDP-glucosyl transferase 88A1 [Pyrus ussuriensis x Pyrus communis]
MESEDLKVKAARIGEAAKKATGAGGAREETLKRLVEEWRKKESLSSSFSGRWMLDRGPALVCADEDALCKRWRRLEKAKVF